MSGTIMYDKILEHVIKLHRKKIDKYMLKIIKSNVASKCPKKLKEVETYEGGFLEDEDQKRLLFWTNPEIQNKDDKIVATFKINNKEEKLIIEETVQWK